MSRSLTEREVVEQYVRSLGPVAQFPYHTQQLFALRAATDKIIIIGGNQSGKSKAAEGIVSRVVRREGPIYARLRKPERPLRIWVSPQTDEKAKSLWEGRLLKMMDGMDYRYVQSPHRVIIWKDEHGGGELWIKSQEQGFQSYESDAVDLCVFDEEVEDRRVAQSAQTRLSTTNGVIVMAYTPLQGMTWTYDEYYFPVAERAKYKIADRVWRKGHDMTIILQGMADNPEAIAGGGVARIEADMGMSPAEKAARLYGTYGFTEGLLFPMWASLKTESKSPFILDSLPRDRAYRWFLTCDPNKRHAAVLIALDHEDNRYYCAEHYAEGLPDSEHAEGYHGMLKLFNLKVDDVEVFADPGGAGGQAIINLAETGFYALPVEKGPGSVSATIKRLRRAATFDHDHYHPVAKDSNGRRISPAPHAYFLRTLRSQWTVGGTSYDESRLLWELRQYRQKSGSAPDTPIKRNDDAVDCARYFEAVHADAPEWVPIKDQSMDKLKADPLSWKEQKTFQKTLSEMGKQKRTFLEIAN